jgi:outer membrane immunogenic protein
MAAPGFLLGIEADADLSGIRETNSGCTAIDCFHSRLHDFGTVRGRVGYAWDQVLFYATGGWAWGFSKAERTVTGITQTGPVTLTASASGALSGWTAGGGIEWGFFRNWSVRVEYLHLEFDRVGRDFTFPGPVTFHINSDNRVEVVRVGMNYLFNWIPTPVFAKY